MFATKKDKGDKKKEEEGKEEDVNALFDKLAQSMSSQSLRGMAIYGDINEESCSEAVFGLLHLDKSRDLVNADPEDPDSELVELVRPIDFYISTHGGQATEMFSVYDTMRMIREETPIHTYGLGKVMSAGVLLLAAGSRGNRRIGRNCRVMIHGVVSGQQGHLQNLENEFEEAKLTQKLYIKALAAETDMTERYIKKLMDRQTNVYLNAEKAIELGIADIIF